MRLHLIATDDEAMERVKSLVVVCVLQLLVWREASEQNSDVIILVDIQLLQHRNKYLLYDTK